MQLGGKMIDHVFGVTADAVDRVRRAPVHPFQTEEIQAVHRTDTSQAGG